MDRLQAMEAFVAVVDAGTFTRAADRMRLPRATVTTLVQNLEAHLKVRLLNRTTRRVSVTADGSAYYERCLRILAEVAETEAALGCSAKCPGGRLRVSVGNSFGRNVLIPALPDFFARYPDIRLELACSDRRVDLVAEQVDCVVRGGDLEDSTLVARKIGSLACVTCATPGYLAQHGTPQHPRELQGHRCVSFILQQTGRVCEWDYTRGGERIVVEPAGHIAVNESEAYFAAGRAGLGIVLAPELYVRADLEAGTLVRILPDWSTDPHPLYVMYPQNRHLTVKVRVFADWVAGIVGDRHVGVTAERRATAELVGA